MSDIAILFGPALLMALVLGAVKYVRTDPGGVWGRLPVLVTFAVAFVGMFTLDAAFLLIRLAWRSMS